MRWIIGLVLAIALATPAYAGGYVVLSGVKEDDPYHKAAVRLAAHHDAGAVVAFDPTSPKSALPALKKAAPRNVAIVMRPEHIDVNFVRRFLRMATQVDKDLFVDFDYGFITGASPEDALAFVENIIKASQTEQPRKVGSAAVSGGQGSSFAFDTQYEVGKLTLPSRSLRFIAPKGADRDQAFIDKELGSLSGCGAIIMGGHGMPWEIGHGPRAEDIGKVQLFPAVAFNYACHTGVTWRYPQREYRGANVIERFMEVEREKSFALNVIRAGVTGYVAYVNPRPAGPELSTDFARVLAGASMGESRRADYAKILLGYLGWGEPGIVPPAWEDGHAKARADVDPVRHMMLDGATGGILYGDPAVRPYPQQEDALPLAKALKRDGDDLHVAFAMPARPMGTWCGDPFRRFPGGKRRMARKLYGRVELPADAPAIRSVWIDEASQGGKAIRTLSPVWAIEDDQGKRYLHLKANFAYGARGAVAVRFVASPRAEVPVEKRAKPEPAEKPRPQPRRPAPPPEARPEEKPEPGPPIDKELYTLALRTNEIALRGDASSLLEDLAEQKKPASLDAVVELIRRGKGHYRTHRLVDVTRSPGDEQKLMALGSGPPLPGHGRWTALRSLGLFDTAEVRGWLLGRMSAERDAGLFMSTAAALAMLKEPKAHKAIARQLLRFEQGWSGVAGHLLRALTTIAHNDPAKNDLADVLEGYVRDERAVNERLLPGYLERLHKLDAARGTRAATAIVTSARFQAFAAQTQARIRKLVPTETPPEQPK